MIAFLEGRLAEATADRAVIDVGGVGFSASISLSTRSRLPETGATCRLLTRLVWREDGVTLYGFASREEADVFDLLIRVSGVGPKIAMAILSAGPPGSVLEALALQDIDALRRYPGVGRKTAERMVLELKDRVSLDTIGSRPDQAAGGANQDEARIGQAVQGLLNLGYSRAEAQAALEAVGPQSTVQTSAADLIRRALQYLASH